MIFVTEQYYIMYRNRRKDCFFNSKIGWILIPLTVAIVGFTILKQITIYFLWYYAPEEFRFAVEDLASPPAFLPWK